MADWRAGDALSPTEKLACEPADGSTATPADVSDDLRYGADQAFTHNQLVELANTTSWENARARFNRTFGIEPHGYVVE